MKDKGGLELDDLGEFLEGGQIAIGEFAHRVIG